MYITFTSEYVYVCVCMYIWYILRAKVLWLHNLETQCVITFTFAVPSSMSVIFYSLI